MSRVLIAPLDWGLGHAARCVPVVHTLQQRNCEVLLAGSGDSLELLRREFPDLPAFQLPAYRPRYPAGRGMVLKMAAQVPRFLKVIAAEHRLVEKLVEREKVDRVISDNRYGCWSQHVPAAFMTHQPAILMPKRMVWMQRPVTRMSTGLIDRFDVCWIPDEPGEHSLTTAFTAGSTAKRRTKVQYIGWLSRFAPVPAAGQRCDVLAILSGPEPQRTLFERTIVAQLRASRLRFRIIRGLPLTEAKTGDPRIVNFLSGQALREEIASAGLVIARSGYSTVMDLHALGKKAIFVPTPGQTEQEYLARLLTAKGIAYHMRQDSFDLPTALVHARKFTGFMQSPPNTLLDKVLSSFIWMGT